VKRPAGSVRKVKKKRPYGEIPISVRDELRKKRRVHKARVVTTFLDDWHNIVSEEEASSYEVTEYDKHGNVIGSWWWMRERPQ
jgi:hypothetical protein